jgi:hypothetical protein
MVTAELQQCTAMRSILQQCAAVTAMRSRAQHYDPHMQFLLSMYYSICNPYC